jgi:hypothetical protein
MRNDWRISAEVGQATYLPVCQTTPFATSE